MLNWLKSKYEEVYNRNGNSVEPLCPPFIFGDFETAFISSAAEVFPGACFKLCLGTVCAALSIMNHNR